jgi:hypothetical protein
MSPQRAEATVALVMRGLAASFAVVGLLFIATPDGVLGFLDDAGDALGSFSPAPETDQKFWLALGFAYMVVIAGLSWVIAGDPVRHRPLLLVLAAGKAASSLSAGAFFVFDDDVFAYLANFVVDLSLVGVALWCWALAGRAEGAAPD